MECPLNLLLAHCWMIFANDPESLTHDTVQLQRPQLWAQNWLTGLEQQYHNLKKCQSSEAISAVPKGDQRFNRVNLPGTEVMFHVIWPSSKRTNSHIFAGVTSLVGRGSFRIHQKHPLQCARSVMVDVLPCPVILITSLTLVHLSRGQTFTTTQEMSDEQTRCVNQVMTQREVSLVHQSQSSEWQTNWLGYY